MHESSAPWRALEDGPESRPSSAERVPSKAPWRTWVGASLAIAAILIGAAIWLIVSGGQGSVGVEGDGPGLAANAGGDGPRRPSGSPVTELVIDVQGAVVRPGIVHLAAGARVADAIAAAGGYSPRVAADRVGQALNLAAGLHDGDQVVVPSRDDIGLPSAPLGGSGKGPTAGPIDLNRATASELDALPGIGPVTAAKIMAAREEEPFTSLDDLRTRKILGAATLEKIRDLVVVR